MELMLLRVFQRQVQIQCEFALKAAAEIEFALQKRDVISTFYGIQNILVSAANLSKALWGKSGALATQDARKPLRDSVSVDDASPLREVRMRNHYEHFDERLDKWWNESTQHHFSDFNLMPRAAIQGIANIDSFRLFDPTTMALMFWGEDFDLQTLIKEISRIHPIARQEALKPHWEAKKRES